MTQDHKVKNFKETVEINKGSQSSHQNGNHSTYGVLQKEDDCWAGRGEFDHQKGWRMTAGQGGVNLTASRSG